MCNWFIAFIWHKEMDGDSVQNTVLRGNFCLINSTLIFFCARASRILENVAVYIYSGRTLMKAGRMKGIGHH
jgi:hypothetical protein